MKTESIPHEPTLADLIKDLWQAKFYWLAGALIGLVLAVGFLAAAVPQYRASMLIAPAEQQGGTNIKTINPENRSLSIMPPMMNALRASGSGDFIRFEHILRAPSVAKSLLEDKVILDGYKQAKNYKFQPDRLPDKSGVLTAEKLATYFKENIEIEHVGTTPLRRLTVQHPDKEFAVYLLRRLHKEAEALIRLEVKDKINKRRAYLQEALKTTNHPDHRRALASLLMEQEEIRMILAMDEPFAAAIAEPPFASVKPYWPRKKIVIPVGILAGMLLGYILYTLRQTNKS